MGRDGKKGTDRRDEMVKEGAMVLKAKLPNGGVYGREAIRLGTRNHMR